MWAENRGDCKPGPFRLQAVTYSLGYRYRLHAIDLPGRPDIVFRGRKKVIFAHGCFWHGHNCPAGKNKPSSNLLYWEPKLARNQQRDAENQIALKNLGWQIMIVWECEVKRDPTLAKRICLFLK